MMAKSAPTPFCERQEAHPSQADKNQGTLLTDTIYSFFSAQFILEGEKKNLIFLKRYPEDQVTTLPPEFILITTPLLFLIKKG